MQLEKKQENLYGRYEMIDIRYNRQKSLDLKSVKKVIVVGCGGIGYNFAKIAAMSGVEGFYLFDDDTLETHNLNRIDVPSKAIGMNKAEMTAKVIKNIRDDVFIMHIPFRLNSSNFPEDKEIEWMADCTDNFKSQQDNYKIAKAKGINYLKAGYDGESFSIHDSPAMWGDLEADDDGYTVIPSWSVPAIVVACLAVAKIMKYESCSPSSDLQTIMRRL